jgi:hypothetical protein
MDSGESVLFSCEFQIRVTSDQDLSPLSNSVLTGFILREAKQKLCVLFLQPRDRFFLGLDWLHEDRSMFPMPASQDVEVEELDGISFIHAFSHQVGTDDCVVVDSKCTVCGLTHSC